MLKTLPITHQVLLAVATVVSIPALALFLTLWVGSASAQQSEAAVLTSQGILAYDDKRYIEALTLFTEALKHDPDSVEALYYLGLVHLAQLQPAAAIEALEHARAKAPQDLLIRFHLGVAYFALEQYEKAGPLLEAVFAEQPKLEGLGYYIGFMRYRKKNYASALDAFKAETSKDPAIQQLIHFYSGLALGIMGLRERAAAELAAATRGDTPTALTGAAERLRDSFAAGGGAGNRFHAELRLGFTYDTNVKVLPQPSNDPLSNAIRFKEKASPGEFASLTLSYDWLRYENWESTIGYQFFQTYVDNFPDFNVMDQAGTLGATYRGAIETGPLAGSRFLAGGQYVFDNQWLGGHQFLQRNTGTLFAATQWNTGGDSFWNPTNVTTPVGRVQGKVFNNFTGIPLPPEENRDAINYMIGLSHTFYWSGDRNWLRVGYQWDTDVARGRNWDYRGNRVLAGLQYTLPWRTTQLEPWRQAEVDPVRQTRLGYNLDVHFPDYLHANTLLPITHPGTVQRSDIEQTHVFSLEQPLPFLRPMGSDARPPLTLRVEYQIGVTSSDIALYKYDRNVVSLSVSYQY
jgi:tetratricopeptide (TPR) repeat protein